MNPIDDGRSRRVWWGLQRGSIMCALVWIVSRCYYANIGWFTGSQSNFFQLDGELDIARLDGSELKRLEWEWIWEIMMVKLYPLTIQVTELIDNIFIRIFTEANLPLLIKAKVQAWSSLLSWTSSFGRDPNSTLTLIHRKIWLNAILGIMS